MVKLYRSKWSFENTQPLKNNINIFFGTSKYNFKNFYQSFWNENLKYLLKAEGEHHENVAMEAAHGHHQIAWTKASIKDTKNTIYHISFWKRDNFFAKMKLFGTCLIAAVAAKKKKGG